MTNRPDFKRRCSRAAMSVSVMLIVGGGLWMTASAQTPARKPVQPLDKDHAAKMAKGLAIFKQHVKPVLMKRCVRCHGGDKSRGEFDLTDRKELLRGGSSGPAVVTGKAKASYLYKLIAHQREPFMPHNGRKLKEDDIKHIAEWIDLGAPYDDPLIAKQEQGPHWTETVVSADAREFWSFRPLKAAALPKVKNDSWCKTPIDYFILAKMEAAGIQPNPQVSKRKLIRRVYLDLIGMPPAPSEVDAFVKDKSSNAYSKLIDRLLNSRHFGERWASHWLDLARFAESHGFEHDYDRKHAYHYRDFVIKAFNMDLPYDTFVRWQIAGDELEPDNALANMATGFLAAGVHSTQITKSEVEKHRYDELDDKLNTLGTAMLGLSIGCARCHDHKYDPIPQADYYKMLSTFTTTVRSEVMLDTDPEWYAKAKAKFDKEHEPLVEELDRFIQTKLPARLAEWEQQSRKFEWVVLDPLETKSAGGATFTRLDEGSLLVSGKNAKFDTYTIKAKVKLAEINAIRLEALAHPSMIKGGPGRAKNGNFALTDFKVSFQPVAKGAKSAPVELGNPRVTFEQKGLPIKAAIDNNAKSAWAIDPQFGKNHAAVFELAKPISSTGVSDLTFVLQFKNNDQHNIGRFRLSASTNKEAALQGNGLPQAVHTILETPAAKRDKSQQQTLLEWYSTIDAEGAKLHQKIKEHLAQAPKKKLVKALIATEGLPAVRLHTQGGDFLEHTHFLKRGDPDLKEGVASQSFLQVLMTAPDREEHWQVDPPTDWRTSYRRVALADWITDTKYGAGHLLARVIVNRLWQHHMGRGIVATPSDFGKRGAPPTHPELLDWLAQELIDNGWKLKPIHKLIMTSAVYLENADFDEAKFKIDEDNKLFWQFPSRRLEAEAIRDSMLAVCGVLDQKMFGPGTLDEASKRRSIYFTVKRSKLIPMLQIFDAPQALTGVGKRPTTTIAPQALLLMNNPHVRSWAKSFAHRIAPDEKTSIEHAVRKGYQIALSRDPTPLELAKARAFINNQMQSYNNADRRELAVTDFCQVMMCLNEFIYVE